MSMPCSLPPRRMGPTMASSSGCRPPSATATAQASLTHPSNRAHQPGSERTSPSGPPEAVVASAKGAKKQSLLQSMVTSSSRTSQVKPAVRSSSHKVSARARVAGLGATCTSTNAESCRTRPGTICSASTRIVPGKIRSGPLGRHLDHRRVQNSALPYPSHGFLRRGRLLDRCVLRDSNVLKRRSCKLLLFFVSDHLKERLTFPSISRF